MKNSDETVPVTQSQIRKHIIYLEYGLTELHRQLGILTEKLHPVLFPKPQCDIKDSEFSEGSPLANDIQRLANNLWSAVGRLSVIIDEIDLE